MSARTAVYFDLETGGVEAAHPDIQLAAIAVDEDSGRELATFETKIAFDERAADPIALELNHYEPEAWVDAVHPQVAVHMFAQWLKPHQAIRVVSKKGHAYTVAKLVGHNAATFDGPRLQAMFKRCEKFLPADPRVRDTLQRAMWFFDETGKKPPQNFKLATLCEYFGVPVTESHEALADVRLTIGLARALRAASQLAA